MIVEARSLIMLHSLTQKSLFFLVLLTYLNLKKLCVEMLNVELVAREIPAVTVSSLMFGVQQLTAL